MAEEVSKEKIQEFLQKHHTCVISTVSPDNKPQSAFVFYVCDEEGKLFFVTNRGSAKYQNLIKNSAVSFVMTDAEAVITVQGEGSAEDVSDSEEGKRALGMLMKVFAEHIKDWPPPVGRAEVVDIVTIRIDASRLRYRDYSGPQDHGDGFVPASH